MTDWLIASLHEAILTFEARTFEFLTLNLLLLADRHIMDLGTESA